MGSSGNGDTATGPCKVGLVRSAGLRLVLFLAAGVVASCGGGDQQPTERRHAPRRPPQGLAILTCPDQGAPTLRFIDPRRGATTRIIRTAADASGPGGQLTATAQCPSGSDRTDGVQVLHTRQQFSPDFARQAATTSQLLDGTTHVGYSDLRTRRFTDISAASAGDGFRHRAANDNNPVFAPDGTQLLFVRDQRDVDTCNLTTRRLTRIARLPATANVASDEAPFVATSDGRTVRALPNPSGTRAILADDSAAALGGARLRLLHPESYAATLRLTEAPNGTTVTPADLSTCTRSVWLDDRTLICRGSRGDSAQSQFQHLRQRNPRQRVNPRPLLPANDRDNYNPVLAPDGTELAFLSKRGTINTLYRTATIAWDRSPGVTRRTRGKRMTGRAARWARDMLAVLGASGPLRVDELPAAVCGCRLLSPLETEAAVDALVCVLARPDVALAGDVLELRTTLAA